ncbi:MAG: hypothetical protein WC421_00815 [Elusimicrobiales bacterium]
MRFTALLLLLALAAPVRADGGGKFFETEIEPDPYYSSIGWYRALTSKPIENVGEKSEWEIYSELVKKFSPRTLILELSVNPLPCAGTYARKQAPDFYRKADMDKDFNLLESITAGFEEPWAASVFLGNVVEFGSVKNELLGKRHGYAGFLASAGNFHIKQNIMIQDDWIETELKLKGEQLLEERALRWSFRAGYKHHGNLYIEDALYAGIRRSRTDFKGDRNPFINNTGIEYVIDLSRRNMEPLRHFLLVDKKFPLKNKRFAFSLGLGLMWTSGKKYTGPLADTGSQGSLTQFLIRPNIEF